MRIEQLRFSEILDSRGMPTLRASVVLENGAAGTMEVPSGQSVGTHEALEKRDTHLPRYHGKGLQQCLEFAQNTLRDELVGQKFADFRALDNRMLEIDGTPQKSNLGANFMLGMSGAFVKACANHHKVPLYQYLANVISVSLPAYLPKPMVNVINGGSHADNNLAIQEFMLMPIKTRSFCEYMRMMSEIFHTLKTLLHKKGLSTNVGNEGGFAPFIQRTQDVFDLLSQATEKAGYSLGEDIGLAVDCAANHFYIDGKYILDQEPLSFSEYIDVLACFCEQYPIYSIEDPIVEDDFEGWSLLTKNLPNCMVVGDDIFVTQQQRLRRGIAEGVANAILIKPNQVGTLTETLQTIDVAREYGYDIVVSHRSGETTDTFIADLAYAVSAPYVKFGSVSRGERICKYNRLLDISEPIFGL
jgi:enolase